MAVPVELLATAAQSDYTAPALSDDRRKELIAELRASQRSNRLPAHHSAFGVRRLGTRPAA
jgi:hypothetical protein